MSCARTAASSSAFRKALRAWHAGASTWGAETDVNSCSIGVEIVNGGHDYDLPAYPLRQIAAVIALCKGIMIRRNIPRERVLGHSDVSPGRKQDPGEKFPWQLLADSGVGLFVLPAKIVPGPVARRSARRDRTCWRCRKRWPPTATPFRRAASTTARRATWSQPSSGISAPRGSTALPIPRRSPTLHDLLSRRAKSSVA